MVEPDVSCSRRGARRDDPPLTVVRRALQPGHQLIGFADGGRQPDAL